MALGPTRWTVCPLVYLQRGPAFYLLCTIDDYADVRQLALHRMLSATALDAKARRFFTPVLPMSFTTAGSCWSKAPTNGSIM